MGEIGNYVAVPGSALETAVRDDDGDVMEVMERQGIKTGETHDVLVHQTLHAILDEIKEMNQLLKLTLGG